MIPFILETSLKPDSSFAFTATVVVAGLFIVLLTLAAMIVIFSLFSRLVVALEQRADKKKNKKQKDEAAVQPDTVRSADELPPPPPIEEGIRPEIVAVITAAIAAAEGENAVVTSIKRAPKRITSGASAWASAAAWQNTRPF